MHGHSKRATLPPSHHAFCSLHSALLFKGAIPCVRTVPRGSAGRSRKAERLARPGASRALGQRLRSAGPGRAGGSRQGLRSSRQGRQHGPLLPPAAATGTGPGRRRSPRWAGAAMCEGPPPPRPGRSAQPERPSRAAAQVSRAQPGKAKPCEWCASLEPSHSCQGEICTDWWV